MSASVETPVVAAPATLTVPAKKKAIKVAKSAAAKPSHPSFITMISDALKKLAERNGSSRQAIVKFIVANYKLDEKLVNQHVKLVLKNGVKSGNIKQSSGVGASGSFKLGDNIKNAEKLKAKKQAALAKKAAKKAAVASKPKVVKRKKATTTAAKPKVKATTKKLVKVTITKTKKADDAKPKKNVTKVVKVVAKKPATKPVTKAAAVAKTKTVTKKVAAVPVKTQINAKKTVLKPTKTAKTTATKKPTGSKKPATKKAPAAAPSTA